MSSIRASRILPVLVAASLPLVGFVACAEVETDFTGPNAAAYFAKGGSVTPTPTGGTGGAAPVPTACVPAGYVSDANCAVKWSTDILPLMKTLSCSGATCHKPGANGQPPNKPPIDDTAADATYAALLEYKIGGIPYFNPCSKNPDQSSFVCNTTAAKVCGQVMPPGIGVSGANAQKIATWVACGAPKN